MVGPFCYFFKTYGPKLLMFKHVVPFLPLLLILSLLIPACSQKPTKPTKHRQHAINKKIASIANDYQKIKSVYEYERSLFGPLITRQELREKLLRLILTQDEAASSSIFNIYASMPLLRYKEMLDNHRIILESYAKKLEHRYFINQELHASINLLIDELEQINDLLVSYPEYHDELLAFDERRHQFAEYLT